MTRNRVIQFASILTALASAAFGDVRLPKILSSHMVLQRERPIHIWGWSDPNEKVSATLANTTVSVTGDQFGRWNLYFPPQSAGGPLRLTVQGNNEISLEDILIGDVWFASGQSNMEMPLNGFPASAVIKNGAEEISRANQPNLRLLFIKRVASPYPLDDIQSDQSWTVCSPETAAKFSAVAYFFGRDLSQQQHVPIGLIDSSWGGTPAEAWMSLEGIASDASLMPLFAARAQMIDKQAELASTIAIEKREDAAARSKNMPPPKHPWRPDLASWDPSWLYNGMVASAIDYPIKGVIWYQGESNTGSDRASLYAKLFPAMITDWRNHWKEGNFPFFFVQIANYNAAPTDNWPLVREAQRRTLSLINTGMVVTADVGEPNNIHPADKQTVGARLALAARAVAFDENIEYSGPDFRQVSLQNNSLRVWFDHAAGLTAKGCTLEGFEIAGDDLRFVHAVAHIDGVSVLVTNPQIQHPKYVRYAWQNAPTVNLYNSAGLPASPFTSEPVIGVQP